MVLPLNLLKSNCNHEILVELKSGETFNGTLVNCDSWMNMNLGNVIWTSRDGSQFKEMKTVHIRGYTVKFIRIEEGMLKQIIEERRSRMQQQQQQPQKAQDQVQQIQPQSSQVDQPQRSGVSDRGTDRGSESSGRGGHTGRGSSGRGKPSGRGRGPIQRGK